MTLPFEFAVVDIETTGKFNKDRVVEIAIVVLDRNLKVIDEYDTLIDPQRDVGPTHIHKITASMLAGAPTFEEAAASISHRLSGRILVAHQLTFDTRFLSNELLSLDASLNPGMGICTLQLTNENLSMACHRNGVSLLDQHRALADARATAELLIKVCDDFEAAEPAHVSNVNVPLNPRTLSREASSVTAISPFQRILSSAPYPTSDFAELAYLDALNWVLDDLLITHDEQLHLERLCEEFGLRQEAVADLHERYLNSIIHAAWRDNLITPHETELIRRVADLLDIPTVAIPQPTELATVPTSIPLGTRICFTFDELFIDESGMEYSKDDLKSIAANNGWQPVNDVTKKNCDLLVAADVWTASDKAVKARRYGTPIMSVSEFLTKAR